MIGNFFQFDWEVKLIEWCQTYLPLSLVKAFDIVSYVGDTLAIVAILGFLYLCYDKRVGKKIAFNAIITLLLAGQLKNVFKRRRPYFDNKNIKCLKPVESGYDIYDIRSQGFSFPSMHSSNISVVFGSLYNCYKTKLLLAISIVFSLVVGISRFVLGCHYPTDVIVGLILGYGSSYLFGKLQDNWPRKYVHCLMIIIMIIGFTFCESSDFYSACGIAIGFIVAEYIDDRYINFKNTKNIIKIIGRLLFAGGLFLAVSSLLKLPFSEEVLEANTFFAHFYRTFRYAAASIIGVGLTPFIYKYNVLKVKENIDGE